MSPGHLLIIGYGYTGAAVARRLVLAGWRVSGTSRRTDRAEAMQADGVTPLRFGAAGIPNIARVLGEVTHILAAAPPTPEGDPALLAHAADFRAQPPQWFGYLSTTGVYGDAGGAWVDEAAPLAPAHERGERRVAAEIAWAELGEETGAPVTHFRLPGIYGPGRSAFDQLRAGTAKRLVKPGQVFSRVHVDDIAAAVAAAMDQAAHTVLNIADDEPAPPQDVVTFAAELLGVAPPPEEDFEAAKPRLSPMAIEFYSATRRIANGRMKEELGVTPAYPSYREGLHFILAAGG